MNIDELTLVTKHKLKKVDKNSYSGVINGHEVSVKAKYTIGKRFLKDLIPNGYSLTIDNKPYNSDKKILLRDIDNILKSLQQ